MNDDSLKQVKAYKVGYDLGWYRAIESVSGELQEIADCILNSATFQQIEREKGEPPIFLAGIMSRISSINQMRQESLPTLIVEREAITRLSEGLMSLLADGDASLDPSNKPKLQTPTTKERNDEN